MYNLDQSAAVLPAASVRPWRLDGAIDQLRSFRHHEFGRIPFQHVAAGRRISGSIRTFAGPNVALVDRLLIPTSPISRPLVSTSRIFVNTLFQRTPRCHDRARHA